LGDALALLRSPEAGNNPLEFVFGDLLDAFTSPETQVLAALSHFTLPATVQHLTEATQLNMEAAQAALFALASRALVLPDKEERHFAIVPLVADYLRRSRPDAIANTGDRLAQRAYALALENGYDEHELFEVLEANWPTITAAIPLLLNGPNDRLQTVCGALQDFLDFTGRWDEWLALSRDAEAKALAGGDTLKAGWRAYNSGWVHYLRGQSSEVLACVDRAAIHWRSAGECERANAIRLRGLGHQIDRNHTAAIEAYREALDLYRSFNYESAEVAMVLNDIASIERETGRYDDAESNYLEALRIANLVDNPEGIAIDTGNLAALALDRKDWPRAEILAREALALSERLGRQELNAANCQRIAKAMARQGHKDQAMPFARRAVAIFSRLGAPDLANAQATLAECEQP
jgi:tetratricopeptide (TPR) repeat protein